MPPTTPNLVRPRVAVASRDVAPANGGGIGVYVHALLDVLVEDADVVLATRASNVPVLERHRSQDTRWALDPRIRIVPVPEPDPALPSSYLGAMHQYSAAVRDALRSHYGERGPDLIEFPDYLGEGCVTVQDRVTGAGWLADTVVAVRVHTTLEVCAVLDGALPDDLDARALFELERFALRHADACLVGGGDVGGLYRRFYGGRLAPLRVVRHPVPRTVESFVPDHGPRPDGPLRILYSGRLERRKGVLDLVEQLRSLTAEFRLTILGGDTDTGPRGTSMRRVLEVAAAGDERVSFLDEVPQERVHAVVADHDVAVVPSLWECWPNVALEALAAGVPVAARPVGGLVEMVGDHDDASGGGLAGRPGGWLARDGSPLALRQLLERLTEDPVPVREPARRVAARRRFTELTPRAAVAEGYRDLLAAAPRPGAGRAASAPRVTVVVPYYRLHQHVATAVRSALRQTHPNVHVVVVDDGSAAEEDVVLREIAADRRVTILTKANAGLGAARNSGIAVSSGPYVVPLDADNRLAPTFVERCLEVLERRPDLEYVTTWSRYVEEDGTPFPDDGTGGWQPLTNDTAFLDRRNVAGDAVALFRRRVFDDGLLYDPELTSYEDWYLYLRMRDRGRFGLTIPERLFDYRVRASSMLRAVDDRADRRLLDEMRARRREQEVEWCPWNA